MLRNTGGRFRVTSGFDTNNARNPSTSSRAHNDPNSNGSQIFLMPDPQALQHRNKTRIRKTYQDVVGGPSEKRSTGWGVGEECLKWKLKTARIA